MTTEPSQTLLEATMTCRIAFTTSGNDLDAPLDSRFGRAPKFLLCELGAETFEVVDNQQNLNAAQGAGIQSAEAVIRLGVTVLVTGHCGPKAFRVLHRAEVKIFHTTAPTVAGALAQYRAGTLTEAQAADVDGHWQ